MEAPNTNRTAQNFSFINIANAIGSGLLNIGLNNPAIVAAISKVNATIEDCKTFLNTPSLTSQYILSSKSGYYYLPSQGGNALGYVDTLFNVASSGEYKLNVAWSNLGSCPTESAMANVSIGSSTFSTLFTGSQTVQLSAGINNISVYLQCNGSSGNAHVTYALSLKDSNGNVVFTPSERPMENLNGVLTGCNGITSKYCSSICAAENPNKSLTANYNNLNLQLAALNNANNIISLIIKTATQPSLPSSLKTQAMWDLRTAGSNGTSGFYPFELLDTTNLSQYKNQQVLIARDNSTNDITINTVAMPALNAQISRKLDIKFDDGKPYTGNIIAGQSAINKTVGTSCTTTLLATPIITTAQWQASAVSTANYINTNSTNLANGCVLGWLII